MRLRALGTCVAAVAIFWASAGDAAAAHPKVWLWSFETGRLAVGSEVDQKIEVRFSSEAYCLQLYQGSGGKQGSGTVVSTGTTTARLKYTSSATTAFCSTPSYAFDGRAASWAITNQGQVAVNAAYKFVVGEPNWCAYEFLSIHGGYVVPRPGETAHLQIHTSVTAKLDKAASLNRSCPATTTLAITVEPATTNIEETLFAEIEG